MSKFFKALEQAERDRLLRPRDRAADIPEPEAATASRSEPAPVAPTRHAGTKDEKRVAASEGRGPAAAPPAGVRSRVAPRPPSPPVPHETDGEPDRGPGVDDRLVSLLDPYAFEAEQYRAVRHAVEEAHRRAGLSVLAVSSAAVGDGKTTTAINLAGTLAQSPDARVLLIDADLRRPSIADRIGLLGPAGPALADLVLDPLLSLDDAVRSRPPFNLSVISSGSTSRNSYELFKSPRLGEVLAEARSRFDYVILDTPPLVHVLDSRVIGHWVDGYVVVVDCHRTSRKQLAEALNMMEPEKVVGLVFNGSDQPLSGSGYYHYAYTRPSGGQKTGRLTWILRAWSRRTRRF